MSIQPFGRTRETAELAVGERGIPFLEEPLLDDKIGDLEGSSVDAYRAWKRQHTRADRFPGGESLDEAATRYADGLAALARLPHRIVLVVTHEIPIRYALNAAAGSRPDLDGPAHEIRNCVPYLFDEPALDRATTDARARRLTEKEPAEVVAAIRWASFVLSASVRSPANLPRRAPRCRGRRTASRRQTARAARCGRRGRVFSAVPRHRPQPSCPQHVRTRLAWARGAK